MKNSNEENPNQLERLRFSWMQCTSSGVWQVSLTESCFQWITRLGTPKVRIAIEGQRQRGGSAGRIGCICSGEHRCRLDRNLRNVLGSFETVQKISVFAFCPGCNWVHLYAKEIGEQIKKALELGDSAQQRKN